MMKLDTSDRKDWQGFSRIVELMTFLDNVGDYSADETRQAADSFCELPPDPGQSMSMEEVVFWAGLATGMEFWRHAEEETIDPATAEKILVFSSIFAHSVKSAIVDLALGELENPGQSAYKWASRLRP